jgi:hypothetical protein
VVGEGGHVRTKNLFGPPSWMVYSSSSLSFTLLSHPTAAAASSLSPSPCASSSSPSVFRGRAAPPHRSRLLKARWPLLSLLFFHFPLFFMFFLYVFFRSVSLSLSPCRSSRAPPLFLEESGSPPSSTCDSGGEGLHERHSEEVRVPLLLMVS